MKIKSILSFLIFPLFITSCFSPKKYKNKKEILSSMTQNISKKHPNVKTLGPLEVLSWQKSNKEFVLIDVRKDDERAISTIKGSISADEFNRDPNRYKDKTVVSFCTIGMRSSDFTEKLQKEGFDAYNLEGGILLWSHQGLSYYKKGQETKRVHVYSEAWDFLAEGYEGVW